MLDGWHCYQWRFSVKKQRSIRKKFDENLQKRRFPTYFRHFRPEKNISQKLNSAIFWALLMRIFLEKNQKKQLLKSWENAKKPVFPAYFRHFWPEKYVFRKSGSVTFRALPFCISVPNFMKKYEVQLEKFKKYRFSGENRLFRRFLESSGCKNQFNWQMNHA